MKSFSHSSTIEGHKVLQWSVPRGSGSNNDRILHGIILLECLDELDDDGALLADGDVNAV